MTYRQPVEVTVLQILQGFAEDNAVERTVAIDEYEAALKFRCQYVTDHRHDRRDAAASRDREVGALFAKAARGQCEPARGQRRFDLRVN